MSARYVLLVSQAIDGSNTNRLAQIPDNGTVPRGYYMLFALNNTGTPSVAKRVKVE